MKTFHFTSKCENDTIEFAKKLATKLQNGDIVILNGDLGAGKTKFVEGFLSYFDLQDEISSPTFTIVNEYKKHATNIYHFDVYRLESSDEFYNFGGDEYFHNRNLLNRVGKYHKRRSSKRVYTNQFYKRRKYQFTTFRNYYTRY